MDHFYVDDRNGCLSLHNIEFDAGPEFVGKKVEVRYDRTNPEFVEVWDNGKKVKTIYPKGARLQIVDSPPVLESADPPKTSRLLDVLEKQDKKRKKQELGAISFRKLGGTSDV